MNLPARTQPDTLAGIALLTVAVACLAALDTIAKVEFLSVPALWSRYVFQAVATTLAVQPKRGWSLPPAAHPNSQCLCGLLLIIRRPGSKRFSWAMLLPLGLVATNA